MRIISLLVLGFFCWTFLGLFEIAHAADQHLKQASLQGKKPRAEEKFQNALEEAEKILADPALDPDTRTVRVKAKGIEIEDLDQEIRKEFAKTEKKLKEAKLPAEILERHAKFVQHYDENLKLLRATLGGVEKAKTKEEADAKISAARAHLEKVKPPKKHVPLDPNKLPHRTAEPTHKKPRLKKEEFQKSGQPPKPILVASAGSLAGLLSSSSLLAQAAGSPASPAPPGPADLAETIEVQFTPEIKAKAQELQNNPVKIYNWVRNNVEFAPTYGSIQGANMCLQTRQCNAFDTASLLIALLRASGIHARYVLGTIQLPIDKAMNWAGGFTDPNTAIEFISSGGIPIAGVVSGGKITAVQMEHVWVEAWVNYFPSRGAVHKQGDTWIPLDGSFKQYIYTPGIDIKAAVPFDSQSFIDQAKATATINEAEGYVTNINSAFIQQQLQDHQAKVQSYLSQNYPGTTVADLLGKKEIAKHRFPYLLGTLSYRTIVKGGSYSTISENLRHKITFTVIKDISDIEFGTPINVVRSLPEIAGKKITVSYSPATSADDAMINSYVPAPHPDGTPLQPNEFPMSLPAYLINLKPELRIDGQLVATGTSIGMGAKETFTMTFSSPGMSPDVITNEIDAGEYASIALNLGRMSQEHMLSIKAKVEDIRIKLTSQQFSSLEKDDIFGTLLHATSVAYFYELDSLEYLYARLFGVIAFRLPSEAIFFLDLSAKSLFGLPLSVSPVGFGMDVDRAIAMVRASGGNVDKTRQFVMSSGRLTSVLEHAVPEQLFSVPEMPASGISAVKALKIANDLGLPIYRVNQANVDSILPTLEVDSGVLTDIKNAIASGKDVVVSKGNITYHGWTGCGYIIVDPNSGVGAYMISGGLAGGSLVRSVLSWMLAELRDPVTNALVAYATGLMAGLGPMGVAMAAVIQTFMISFTVTDILINHDGTLTQKGNAILTYLTIQGAELLVGALSVHSAAAFVAGLIINVIYLELLNAVLQKYILPQP